MSLKIAVLLLQVSSEEAVIMARELALKEGLMVIFHLNYFFSPRILVARDILVAIRIRIRNLISLAINFWLM